MLATFATPIYQGDALVQVERRSTLSPFAEPASLFVDGANSPTAAEVQILKSRMVLGQVVERVELDTVVTPATLPVVGDYLQRRQITRPAFLSASIELARWFPESIRLPDILHTSVLPLHDGKLELPDALQSSLSLPSFLQARSVVWGGEFLRLGRFEVADSFRGRSLIIKAGDEGTYTIFAQDPELRLVGQGRVGTLESFENGDIELRLAELEAAPGAQFTLVKHSRSTAVRRLGERLQISEEGADRTTNTGILRLTLRGSDRDEIHRSLNAVVETFLTQNVSRQSAETEQSLAFLEEQAPLLRDQLASAEDRLNQYRSEQNSVDLSSEAQATIQQFVELDSQLSELEFQEAELAQRYTANHPTYQALLSQKWQLQQRRAQLNARVDELPAAQQEVVRRTRDVEVTQAIYINMLNRIQELQVAKAGTVGNVRIIDNAQVDEIPIEPRKGLMIVLSTMLGGMLTTGGVLVRGLLNPGIEIPEQLESAGLPVYATVPLSEEQKRLVKRVKHRNDRIASEASRDVLARLSPADGAIEALRSLRTSLHFAMLDASNNCLMITGASPGIGKSFVATNLATICAQAGQRVLLVDADLRKGHLHHAFHLQSDSGLSEILSNRLQLEDAIRHTEIDGLDFISRGIAPPNPSELLMTECFARFLDKVAASYDLVIVDTPPVLAVTDAAVVGAQCGTTLLVARFQVNTPREIQLATRRLENAGVAVKGAILNAMERKAASSYGYGYYQYAYR